MTLPPIVRLMRPHQYTKNLLVFSAPGAAGRLDEPRVVWLSLSAFALFCIVSSAGYVANDLVDVDADRLHPSKRHRPIANGSVTPATARALLAVLAIGGVVASPLLGWDFSLVLVAYAMVSASYSAIFKRVRWIELVAVSAGFLLRAVAGGAATDTAVSGWFLLVVSAGALLVIIGKRLGELLSLGSGTPSRKVLAGYGADRLRLLASLAAGLALGGYGTWAAAAATDQAEGSTGRIFLRLTTVPFGVAIGRYLVLSWRGAGETPESLVVRDRVMFGAGLCWMALYAIGIYA